jgi:HSP20 family molecular chaperone IbpA
MKNQGTAMAKASEKKVSKPPFFVEAEQMLDKMANLTKETSQKAFEYFINRGGTLGSRFDDWLHAEMELLRPVPVEITETDKLINIRAAVPGFKPDEIELSVKDNELFLTGETRFEDKKEDEKTFYTEWRSNRFYRQLRLPTDVLSEGADAKLKDGILTLVLKKKPITDAAPITVKAV